MSSTSSTTSSTTSSSELSESLDMDPSNISINEIGKQFPRIVDVAWRLSLVTNTSSAKKVNEPVYLIRLTVADDGLIRNIEFSCNTEEMNDLVQKLKEATSQVERSSSSK
ncbi:putative COMM domain containing 3 [Monocercomonoides exilis]|uniref:putative COMM domain containing 3 n=1 Tax=Monocercomonoides exilis TaxID=2049356 RepID=UPI0035599A3A|nr:putative COMM domain containing 3 [Monocercomonoides exilis]|eukprot:MONOS_1699.1-p1 / transcript=MONOS_1699.1 / gene=MONOS_1699 / organism=Monocercomonoides_exilis_PA203 / gene_product=unspecified product / transcript_product=unspecified product / location=Mono_scaffold00031:136594-136923(-) / protein_length=109 / sequence_SO=supercontig / SO=protein_coding / is_pseudo=false